MNGKVHVYTGNGKGKTTAALGIALRAVGAGKEVFFAQFVKGMRYAEVEAIDMYIPGIKIQQFGLECFIEKAPTKEDIEKARHGLEVVTEILKEGKYDLVVLDEANIALYYKLFSVEELLLALNCRSENVEVVITGRYSPEALNEYADLVTEMKEIKHYYNDGLQARKGIEF
ncbi:MAG: cob(I)yrinic acid a,c-diamide adenosyltransferase [Marinilabiliales bacterium]|nr:MAG: cob(I)yrinic acid a,c-diamide adenosyltransferase [Marinilabiliales bacterium]